MISIKQAIGNSAEKKACDHLTKNGLKCLTKQYRCKAGEIDLIMKEAQTLVFVEVRFRSNDNYGSALESIDTIKQRKIGHAANHYLMSTHQLHRPYRFDIVTLSPQQELDWIKNAFAVQ